MFKIIRDILEFRANSDSLNKLWLIVGSFFVASELSSNRVVVLSIKLSEGKGLKESWLIKYLISFEI